MKKLLYLMPLFLLILPGCSKFLDVNKDPNNPIDVQESLLLPPLELNTSDNIYAGFAATLAQNFMQSIAPIQPNPGFWNYQVFNNDLDGEFATFYVTSLNNLKILVKKAEANNKPNYAAVAKILTAYTLGTATDIWGDLPWSEGFAGVGNLTPKYDSQESIYKVLQSLLNEAIGDINKGSLIVPKTDDYFYGGQMAKWKKLAYVLKARYFMHLAKAPGHTAAIQADSVLNALQNGMTSSDDDLKMAYAGDAGTENDWGITFGPVSTYVLNETFVEGFKTRNDPRLPLMVKPAVNTGLYTGRRVGATLQPLNNYSYPADFYGGLNATNAIVTYSEALFLKAEATLTKSGFAAASLVYIDAVKLHFSKIGMDPNGVPATTYLATRALTAGNALQRIIEEKAIANPLNIENFADWRRTGFPALTKVDGALSNIPRRLPYPQTEQISNPQPQQSAALTDRVWWDVQ
jgi:hypothetical protein